MRWDIGAYRNNIRKKLKAIQRVKIWQLIVILLLGSIVAATLLRINNLNMVDLLQAVKVADKEGDKEKIKQSITNLGQYVTTHMHTDVKDKLNLEYSYERDKEAALTAAQSATNPNSEEYKIAAVECQARWQGGVASFRNDYVKCVIDRVAAMSGQSAEDLSAQMPRAEMYNVTFASPLWSPDPAGFAVAFCVIITIIILMRLTGAIILQLLIKKQFRAI
jgi:hypothetical protein